MTVRSSWDQKRVDELKKAIAKVDKPRSTRPRKPKECKQHEFIESDICHWCGTPQEKA